MGTAIVVEKEHIVQYCSRSSALDVKDASLKWLHSPEVDATKGKISIVSPIGKAIIGHGQGEVIEVTAPAGKLCYQIKQIER